LLDRTSQIAKHNQVRIEGGQKIQSFFISLN